MKAPSLLFSLPLLLTTLAVSALSPESGSTTGLPTRPNYNSESSAPVLEDPVTDPSVPEPRITGPARGEKYSTRLMPSDYALPGTSESVLKTIWTRGKYRQFDVMTGQYHVRRRDGTESIVDVPGAGSLENITAYASLSEFASGDRADLIAFKPGLPRTERNKALVTKMVTVRLAQGVVPSVFGRNLGALRKQRASFAPEALILTYASALEAIEAVELLRELPGVLSAENMLALKRVPEFIPNTVRYFERGAGPEYTPDPWTDNIIDWRMDRIINTSAYQWWANNQVNPAAVVGPGSPVIGAGPWSSPPAVLYLGDFLPLEYNPLTPRVHGEQADLRLPVVWEILGDFDRPISGRGLKVAIIDDGIQKSQPDLQLALDLNPTHHYNFFTDVASPEPLDAAFDTHGTSMAGFVGARLKVVNSNIVGVAPGCQLQSQVALKGYVDDIDWAQAFVPGSTLTDSDEDNDLLDETRTGITYTEIVLNSAALIGSQDALDLYPEEWLWRRAMRFGSTMGRSLSGVIYITSAGNGAEGHMNTNYVEQKNCMYQIPVGSISDHGRQLAYSNKGSNLVCVGLSGTDELPPLLDWGGAPAGWPANLPIKVNAPLEADDLPFRWRRFSSGTPTLSTNNRVDFDFTGTSASAAQVAGVVALMMEKNKRLQARDVKEILLRSGRVCNDVRTTHDDRIVTEFNDALYNKDGSKLVSGTEGPTMWRMGFMGVPLHYAYGAGLIDANRAVKIAEMWPPLPVNTLPPRQLDVEEEGFGTTIADRNSETGGIYYPAPSNMLIPTDGREIEVNVPPPPNGIRLEHIEVRMRVYHKRRGDLQVTLVAPPELGWETGRTMESKLFVPHREDYSESRWDSTTPALRDATDWTFSTVRHWGTKIPNTGGGQWKVLVRDAIDAGKNEGNDVTLGNPVFVPIDNPTDPITQRLEGIGITYHGTTLPVVGNDPPVIVSNKVIFSPGSQIVKTVLRTEKLATDSQGRIRFPITSWDFFHTRDIVPYHPTQTAHEPFEYFPPAWRNPLSPPDLDPPDLLRVETYLLGPWPSPPFTAFNPPLWIAFDFPNPNNLVPPDTGSSGGMTSWPLWGPLDNGNPTPMERSADGTFMVIRDERNSDNQTNFMFVRLNRKKGELETVTPNKGLFQLPVYAESLIGRSRLKVLDISVEEQLVINSWRDIWWNEPELSDENVSGWEADPDHDGLPNGLEYMMRLNPTIFDSSGIPGYRIEGNEVVFSYQEDTLVVDGDLVPQISEDLENWADVTATEVGVVLGMRQWEYRTSIAEAKIFFRLQARLTP